MKEHKKVTEMQVLEAFGNIEIIGQWFIPKSLVAQHLQTSIYQVNKHCKTLIEKGFLETSREEPFHEHEYESGVDYGNSLSIWVTSITEKGTQKLKDENLYIKRWYEEEFE